jgi:hypothetical protein
MAQEKKTVNMTSALDALMDIWDEDLQGRALENNFPYIYSKAYMFLEKGAVLYRKDDFFHEPPVDYTEEDIEILKNGCRQVLEGRGLTADFPFINLDVGGFYALFRMFHYENESRKTKYSFRYEGKKGILDHITFAHIVDDNTISFFNFVGHSE